MLHTPHAGTRGLRASSSHDQDGRPRTNCNRPQNRSRARATGTAGTGRQHVTRHGALTLSPRIVAAHGTHMRVARLSHVPARPCEQGNRMELCAVVSRWCLQLYDVPPPSPFILLLLPYAAACRHRGRTPCSRPPAPYHVVRPIEGARADSHSITRAHTDRASRSQVWHIMASTSWT